VTTRPSSDAEFLARQAVFLQRQGVDAGSVESRIAASVEPRRAAELRARLAPRAGGFRASLARSLEDLNLPADELTLRGLALEQSVAEAYLGLWRGMTGFAIYTLGIAAVATIALLVMTIFVVPQFVAMMSPGGGIPRMSHLVFESGLGAILLALLWLLAAWSLLSTATARRAILLRGWSRIAPQFNLLESALLRHRTLLHAWTSVTLIENGLAPDQALVRARAAVASWCGKRAGSAEAEDDARLATAASLGTLQQELEYRVANELVDAPLALAARRERLALYAGLVSAFVVVQLLLAMYVILFKSAAMV
jgi:amino acid transporter